jgi:hypothetical protein
MKNWQPKTAGLMLGLLLAGCSASKEEAKKEERNPKPAAPVENTTVVVDVGGVKVGGTHPIVVPPKAGPRGPSRSYRRYSSLRDPNETAP